MESLKLNETPVRTSRNFNINNAKLKNVKIPEKIEKFSNVKIENTTSKIKVLDLVNKNFSLQYGLGDFLGSQIKNKANQNYKIVIDSKTNKEVQIEFRFDSENMNLVDNIEIEVTENSKGTVIIKYENNGSNEFYHNGVIRMVAEKNSDVNVIIVNLLNINSNNFISIENNLEDNSKVKYTIIDFGGKNSITNYFSNLKGRNSENILNTIYLGRENQFFDLNYIAELKGQESNVDIDVQGALKDSAKKNFKGTIDFKRGAKKSKGNENEFCMLLSDKAKAMALPMLLCSEEDVEGNHSTSSGKAGEKELFYIMSRGFEYKEAMKLLVKANFNKILCNIDNEALREQVLHEIDNKLD